MFDYFLKSQTLILDYQLTKIRIMYTHIGFKKTIDTINSFNHCMINFFNNCFTIGFETKSFCTIFNITCLTTTFSWFNFYLEKIFSFNESKNNKFINIRNPKELGSTRRILNVEPIGMLFNILATSKCRIPTTVLSFIFSI